MKRNFLLLFASGLSLLMACNKESKDSSPNGVTEKSSIALLKSATISVPSDQASFTIKFAGFAGEYLYLPMSYLGRTMPHQFSVVWDGTLKTENEKIVIELSVSHLTNNDTGTTVLLNCFFKSAISHSYSY